MMIHVISLVYISIQIIYSDIATIYIRPSYRSNTQVVKKRGDTDRHCRGVMLVVSSRLMSIVRESSCTHC